MEGVIVALVVLFTVYVASVALSSSASDDEEGED